MKLRISNETQDDGDVTIVSPLRGNNIYQLDVADSECDEIVCLLTDKIPVYLIGEVLAGYVKKLRHNGKIIFVGKDILEIARRMLNRNMNILQGNEYLFGGPEAHNLNSSCVCANDIAAILQKLGLKIVRKSIDEFTYTVEAQRP